MPTLHTSEILRNTLIRIGVAFDAHEQGKLEQVRLFNYTTQAFGRSYYRIELTVALTELFWFNWPVGFGGEPVPVEPLSESQQATNQLHDRLRHIPEYVSFNQDHETEKEAEIYYDWISALVAYRLGRIGASIQIERFETEDYRQYKREQERERPQREQEQQAFLSTYAFLGEPGDFAVVEDYYQTPKLIKLDREKVYASAPYSGQELKNDFTAGKRRLDYVNESRILAIFTAAQLAALNQSHPFTRAKAGLLQVIKESRTGLTLKYSKPEPPKAEVV